MVESDISLIEAIPRLNDVTIEIPIDDDSYSVSHFETLSTEYITYKLLIKV